MGRHLATFTRRPRSSLYTLATEPPQVAASAQVSTSGQVAASCSCRLLSHQTLMWHHRLGHPSLPRLRGIHSRFLVSSLPKSLPPLPPSPAPPCLPCVEGRQRAAPHSSFPLTTAPVQTLHMDLREHFGTDLPVLRLHSDRGGEFSSDLLQDFCRGEGILQSFTLPDSPQQNGIAECRIGLCMEVPHTSMIHAATPHFLWPFAPETSPTLRWMGKVGDASMFRVWGSRAFVRDTSAYKLSARAIPCVFLGFVPDASGWQFYHPTSRRVLLSQDVTLVELVPFYYLFPYCSAPPPPPPLFFDPRPPPLDPPLPQGPPPSGVSQVDPLPGTAPNQVAVGSGAAPGAASGAHRRGGAPGAGGIGNPGAEGAAVTAGDCGTRGTATTGPGGARTSDAGAAGTRGVGCTGAGDPTEPGGAGVGGPGTGGGGAVGAGAGSPGAVGAGAVGAGVGGIGVTGARATGAGAVDPGTGGAGGTVRPRPYFVPLLQQPPLQTASPLPAPSPYTDQSGGLTERREPASRLVLPVRTARRTPHSCPPPLPGTHAITLRHSSVPLRVPLRAPSKSSLPEVPDPASDRAHATSPTVSRLLATANTDPSFESATASDLVAELLDFAAPCCLDYATALVAESVPAGPPSVGGECALGTDVLEDRQEDFECLAATVPRSASMLLAPEGDLDAPDIPTPRSYAEPITGPYSSQWQAAMDAEIASWKSTGTYVDVVPSSRANIVDGMWIFRVKRPPGSLPVFKACYVARGFSQRQGVDCFQTFSPTPKMTTLLVLLHVAAQREYELHSLDFSTAFLQGARGDLAAPTIWTTLAALGFAPSNADPSLFLRTDTSLPPFYILVFIDDLVFATADTEALILVKSELHKRHTCTELGELRSYLGLQITRDRARRTITLTQSHMVHQVLQRFGFQFSSPQPTPLSTSHSLSAPPSDESVEPSGPYPELVGWLMHRKVHWDAAKGVLRYLCSTSGMGLVLGRQGPNVLTGHADASWVDNSATQRLSQGYTFSLGSGSVSWPSTHSSLVLSSSCEAEIYAGAMAAQELRWLTDLLNDLGEQPSSPPVPYVDNKAMIALCHEHRLEHRMKHIALRYFLA
ncbi:unnamed protein product [Closterium sp. NIES-54]